MTKFDKRLQRIPINPGRTGRVPLSAKTGIPSVNTEATMRLWSGHRMIYQMPFHPPIAIGLTDCNNFKYYPIFRFPDMEHSTVVQLCGRLLTWTQHYSTETAPEIRWYQNYTPGTPGSSIKLYSGANALAEDKDYGDKISPWYNTMALEHDDFTVATDGGDFFTRLLETDSILPAALAIFRAGIQSAPASDWQVTPADCAYGKVLRESGSEIHGLGRLLSRATTELVSEDYITTAAATPLFAWGHHHGIWVGQGETDHNIFGTASTIKITAKPIYKDANQLLDVAIVCSAGVECTMTIAGSGNADGFANITIPANANPGIAYSSVSVDALRCSTTSPGDLTFEVTTPDNSSANDWCIIHSISVYPANS